ncbi:MAG: PAS domain S-box protein, partial [Proteobacteria bacterium]|nr:PAS domain S-box protein [Pseudomonadota bacterium]
MNAPAYPDNEGGRHTTLCRLNILDTKPEERFDRLTRITQSYFDVPIALVSLVDSHRLWFKSRQGLDATETPRDISFCGHAILAEEVFYVPDTFEDERFVDNPLVTGPPNVRFYAGAPLSLANGMKVGTLCIFDTQPRSPSEEDFQVLRDLADCVIKELDNAPLLESSNALTSQEARLRAVLDTVIEGIITIDDKGKIETFNPAAARLFGYSVNEVIGKNIKILMPEPYHGEHDGYLLNYKETRNAKIIGSGREVTGQRKDGSTFPMELAVSEIEIAGARLYTGIVRDISERKLAETNLSEKVRELDFQRATLDEHAIVSIADVKGNFTYVNDKFCEISGYSREELLGRNHRIVKSGDYTDEFYDDLWQTISSGKVWNGEIKNLKKGGGYYWVDATIVPFLNELGRPFQYVAIRTDVTERVRAKEEAERANLAKSEFLSSMSHELRTPMNAIMGFTQMLEFDPQEPLSAEQKKSTGRVLKSAEHLLSLIDDVLDFAKIEAGSISVSVEKLSFPHILDNALEMVKGMAAEHGIQIHAPAPEAARFSIQGDYTRLSQCLVNLLSNAVKYNREDGTVTVSIAALG